MFAGASRALSEHQAVVKPALMARASTGRPASASPVRHARARGEAPRPHRHRFRLRSARGVDLLEIVIAEAIARGEQAPHGATARAPGLLLGQDH